MGPIWEYATFEIRARTWPRVLEALRDSGRPAVERAGGSLDAIFTPQIGMGSNRGVLMTSWSDDAAPARTPGLALRGIPEIVDFEAERLRLAASPRPPEPPRRPGVYAHRWFEIAARDRDEFVDLSHAAWPDFEAAHDARIQGLFEVLEPADPAGTRLLLVTRYGSLAVWERSRRAEGDRETAAWRRFARRHELTRSTVVATFLLAGA